MMTQQLVNDSRDGFLILTQAYQYAQDAERSPWDFAVEVERLKSEGLSFSELRWLVCKDFALHGIETTLPSQTARQFHHVDSLNFAVESCITLTPHGFSEIVQAINSDAPTDAPQTPADASQTPQPDEDPHDEEGPSTPIWCAERRELTLNGLLVKRFRVPSPNQETILAAFEEEEWPIRIDDPLPVHGEIVAKRRLQDTIKSLNRNQKNAKIRFLGDGSGEGIIWQIH